MMSSKSCYKYGILVILTLLACAAIIRYQLKQEPISFVQDKAGQGEPQIGGPFSLIDQNGNKRSSEEFKGKFMLVYFGYSFCPDICPTGLQNMTKALKLLGRDRDQVVPIFITVDPIRDTVDHLKIYATNFHPDFLMLTGNQTGIDQAIKAYRVYAARSSTHAGLNDYLIDHSTLIYLMDKEGKFLQHFPHSIEPEVLAKSLHPYLFPTIEQKQ